MQDHKTLRAGEMFALTILLVGLKFTDSTAALLSQEAQNAFWYIPLLAFMIMLPSFIIMLALLNKYQDKHLIELLEAILGRLVGKCIGFVLFLGGFILIALDSRNYAEQIQLLYFPNSDTLIIFTLFVLLCFFSAKKGFEVIGFSAKVFLPFIIISMLLLALLVFEHVVWERVFPIFGSGATIVFSEGLWRGSLFIEFFLLMMAYTVFRSRDDFLKGGSLGMIISISGITFFFFIYTTIFDYNSIEKISFPFHEVTQYVNLGDFFTNIETFFMVFWLLASIMRFVILFYLITWVFAAIFNINEFEPLLLPISYLLFIFGLLPDNSVMTELVYRNKLLDYMTPFIGLLPFFLWGVSYWKGKGDASEK